MGSVRKVKGDPLHKLLKEQGNIIACKTGGPGLYIYKLLRSLLYYRGPHGPSTPTADLEGFREGELDVIFLGLDPGQGGALGLVTNSGAAAVIDYSEPKLWRHLLHALGCLHASGHIFVTAYLELLHMTGGFNAHALESMMRTSGIWTGALTMAALPYAEVLPQEWQKHHNLTPKEVEIEHRVQWKTIHASKRTKLRKQSHRRKALELLPHMQTPLNRAKDHDRADALLMALMARDNRDFI